MLEKLAQDTDMDVKYFAQEAISGEQHSCHTPHSIAWPAVNGSTALYLIMQCAWLPIGRRGEILLEVGKPHDIIMGDHTMYHDYYICCDICNV